MLKRVLSLVVVVCVAGGLPVAARGDNVLVQLFPYTGDVRFSNPNATPLSFVYYELNSGGALNGNAAVWKSVADVYDVSGNGYIDPLNNWTKFSSSSTQLAEGVFPNPGGSLLPFRTVSLGNVWNPIVANPALTAMMVHPNNQFATVTIDYDIDGDYNDDDVVNRLDYDFWKLHYGESGTLDALKADGNMNGTVDVADYTVWRNHSGLNLAVIGFPLGSGAGAGAGLSPGGAVPEPGAAILLVIAGSSLVLWRRRRWG